jgi:cytochrome P450
MTYAVYRLCCHPEWQDKLRKEIRASKAKETGFAYQTLQALPVLNAILMETLRLHPAAPSALPRVTTAKSTTIAGIQFPSRVRRPL